MSGEEPGFGFTDEEMAVPDYGLGGPLRGFGGVPIKPVQPDYFGNPNRPDTGPWRKHEADVAARTGDRLVTGSGNQPGKPGDTMGTDRIRQCKECRGAGISVSAKEVRKLVQQALDMNRRPIMEVRLLGAEFPVPQDWIFVPVADYDDLEERARG